MKIATHFYNRQSHFRSSDWFVTLSCLCIDYELVNNLSCVKVRNLYCTKIRSNRIRRIWSKYWNILFIWINIWVIQNQLVKRNPVIVNLLIYPQYDNRLVWCSTNYDNLHFRTGHAFIKLTLTSAMQFSLTSIMQKWKRWPKVWYRRCAIFSIFSSSAYIIELQFDKSCLCVTGNQKRYKNDCFSSDASVDNSQQNLSNQIVKMKFLVILIWVNNQVKIYALSKVILWSLILLFCQQVFLATLSATALARPSLVQIGHAVVPAETPAVAEIRAQYNAENFWLGLNTVGGIQLLQHPGGAVTPLDTPAVAAVKSHL